MPPLIDAIRLTGSLAGMVIDPVYEGKSMAELIDLITRGGSAKDSTVPTPTSVASPR
jgi:1-aminocyclopropane-1-carboxylate deaminase